MLILKSSHLVNFVVVFITLLFTHIHLGWIFIQNVKIFVSMFLINQFQIKCISFMKSSCTHKSSKTNEKWIFDFGSSWVAFTTKELKTRKQEKVVNAVGYEKFYLFKTIIATILTTHRHYTDIYRCVSFI